MRQLTRSTVSSEDGHVKAKVLRGAAWITVGRVAINVLAFASTLLLARLLAPADFGLIAIATTVIAIISSLSELSLAQALIHHPDPEDDHFHTAWTLNFLRGVILAVVIGAIAWPVSEAYSDPRLLPVMCVIAVFTLLTGAANPKVVVLSRRLEFRQEVALGLVQSAVSFVIGVGVALVWRTYWALVAGLLAGQLAWLITSYVLVRYRPLFRLGHLRELISFSGWLSLGQAVNTLNWRADYLTIGYFLGNSAMGHYTVGDRLALLPTREATAPLFQTLFPALTLLRDDPVRLRNAYQKAQAALCAVALPCGFGVAMIAQPLVILTMGEKWLAAVPVIQFLAGIFAVQTLGSGVQPLALALGETRRLFHRDVLNLVVRLPLIAIGLLLGSLMGIVYARCVSGLFGMILNMRLVRDFTGLRLADQFAPNMRALCSTAIMILITVGAQTVMLVSNKPENLLLQIVALISIGATSYIAAIFSLWSASGRPDGLERDILSALTRRLAGARRSPDLDKTANLP